MQASWMLIKAQLKNKKGGYISIFILTLVIGLMLSLSLSLVVNINSAARDAIEASNFGDLYMNFNPDYVPTDEDFDKLRQMPEFKEVTPLKKIKVLGKPANIVHADGEKTEVAQDPAVYVYDRDQLSLRLFTAERTAYLSGDQAVPPPRGEVYVPVAFTAMYNAKPGDRYVMAVEEETFEYKVAGFVEDITQINMVSIGEHNVYMNQADFDELRAKNYPEFHLTYTLHLYTAGAYADCDTNELFRRIEDSSGLRSKTSFFVDDEMFVRFASTVSYMVLLIVIVFVIVMFIAGLAILNFNIYSSVEAEYRNIGVMKAVGLK
ncbi:MAG: hypothetical protein GX900_08370, partial [Clostridiaceae bacterium]|nr:hypothetical protein [Clostridiaceae bacterium]